MEFIIKLIYVMLGFVYLKSNSEKIKEPHLYFVAMKDYNIIKNHKILYYLTPLLISLELLLAMVLITTIYSELILLFGIIVQGFYIFILVKNVNHEFQNNCGCFTLNAPKTVTTSNLAMNISFLVLIVLLYGWESRI